jgi:hypothetical protein
MVKKVNVNLNLRKMVRYNKFQTLVQLLISLEFVVCFVVLCCVVLCLCTVTQNKTTPLHTSLSTLRLYDYKNVINFIRDSGEY